MQTIAGVRGRMADADQQKGGLCENASAVFEAMPAAVSQLFREHHRILVRYLTVRLQSVQEAQEVAQESYARLLQVQRLGAPALLRAYLFKTATNLAIDRLRQRKIQRRVAEQPDLTSELTITPGNLRDPAEQLLAREQAELLLGYLQELPTKCQRVFDLHRLEGVSQHTVSVRLGFSERMVRRYVTYAMVYCHLRLQGMTIDQVRKKVSL